ncbi:MAG: biopolymer transporter ExbD [Crocinitomicaceae bacterium]|nr:biopolymer transporter ExbD [Crocinitomicaceae bacterium]
MSKFRKDGKKGVPGINSGSLPDIIFMLLFFFMVATRMKENKLQVEIIKPKAEMSVELEDKDNVDFLYIGFPVDVEKEGTEPRVQLDDQLINDIQAIGRWKNAAATDGKTPFDVPTSLKVHQDVSMLIVSNVKEVLRDVDALKIVYSTDMK